MLGKQDGGLESNVKKIEEGGRATKQQLNSTKKWLQNRLFFALASRSGFGATISDAIARSSLVFCNSVSADRIGMAASRSFEGSLARNAFLALVIFLLKILLKSASKSSFFRSGVEIRFWSYNFRRRCA